MKLSVAKPLIQQVAHHGIADEDALGREMKVIVGGVYELSSMYIGRGTAQAVGVVAVAEVGAQTRKVDAACRTQFGDDALIVAFLGGQVLHFVRHILARGRGDIVGEATLVPSPVAAVVGVCTRAQTNIGNPLPIAAVVARVIARKGKVGNLIMLIASCQQLFA